MARSNRPVSRKKRVGSGSGKVEKRGSGLGQSGSGPAGGAGGFFTRRPATPASSSSTPSTSPSGGLGKMLLPLVIIGIVIYIFSSMGGGPSIPGGNNIGPGISTGVATYDRGAYAVNRAVADQARDKWTQLVGNGQDQVTVMVYLLGTDLESRSGMATRDLQEMLDADLSGKVNIVIETGGTSQWKNNVIDGRSNQDSKRHS
jgi:hypothetical protein